MNSKFITLMAGFVFAIVGCSTPDSSDDDDKGTTATDTGTETAVDHQPEVDRVASALSLNYEVVSNLGSASYAAITPAIDCGSADWGLCSTTRMTLTSSADIAATDKSWKLYFTNIRRIVGDSSAEFDVTKVNGDLHVVTPTDAFTGFTANSSKSIDLKEEYWKLFISDFFPRAYVAAEGTDGKVIANTNTLDRSTFSTPILTHDATNYKRVSGDANVLQTADTRRVAFTAVNGTAVNQAAIDAMILPTPRSIADTAGTIAGATADLGNGVKLSYHASFPTASQTEVGTHLTTLGLNLSDTAAFEVATTINTAIITNLGAEYAVSGGYQLKIEANRIDVVGFDNAGVFYGLKSLASLVRSNFETAGNTTVLTKTVNDSPRFDHRGLEVDVARNFVSKAQIMKIIRTMAAYKGNKLHLHLTDDEGWRVEIEGLPELTDVGARRCHNNSGETTCLNPALGSGPNADTAGTGYYSKADYQEIVALAQANFVRVIPEIDMPAHARAAVISMEARYKKYEAAGNMKAANEYRLLDPEDTSRFTSVQLFNDSYINPCQASTFRFVEKVIVELAAMHTAAGQPMTVFHAGGDEAKNIFTGGGYSGKVDQTQQDEPWSQSPACDALAVTVGIGVDNLMGNFMIQVSDIASQNGVTEMMAWNDGVKAITSSTQMKTALTVNNWDTLFWGGNASTASYLAKGFGVVVDSPDFTYFDFPYEVDPEEVGYYWGTRQTDTKKIFGFAPANLPQNAETAVNRDGSGWTDASAGDVTVNGGVKGLQGHLWGETMLSDASRDYMAFPRMLGLLERAWHKADWELTYSAGETFSQTTDHQVGGVSIKTAIDNEWVGFANLLGQKELAKLDKMGVEYRIPVAGGSLVAGSLVAYPAFPGLKVQFQATAGAAWQDYDFANQPNAAVAVRTVSASGTRFGRSVPVAQ